MKYDPKVLGPLIEDLKALRTELRAHAETFEEQATKLSVAWEGNQGFEGFRDAKKRFDNEFGTADTGDMTVDETTIGKLNGLGRAVEAAWQNAVNQDAKVGQAFGG